MYDYLVVGAGLFGAVFAQQMVEHGRTVLIIDKRDHIGGNAHTIDLDDICVHVYGPHLFHTNKKYVWDYLCRFAEFNHYQHRVKANYKGKIYSLPFNLMTYYQLWGCTTPTEAQEIIKQQIIPIQNPRNVEEWALSNVGRDIYDTLIYGYTKKQWKREPRELPSSIIKRLPLRMTYDDNYFDDPYQGVPKGGYTSLVENILDGIDIKLSEDFFAMKDWRSIARKLVYTGPIDEFFAHEFGPLEYRTLRFENKIVDGNFQGVGQMNYTDADVPWTRIIEHKHFRFQKSEKSVITYEYPDDWDLHKTPYYPINNDSNHELYIKYKNKFNEISDAIGGGRLFEYKYMDMDTTIASSLKKVEAELK